MGDLGHARATRAWQQRLQTERRILDRHQLQASGGTLPAARLNTPQPAAASESMLRHQQLQRDFLRPPSRSTGMLGFSIQSTRPQPFLPLLPQLEDRQARSTFNRKEWLSGAAGTGWQEPPRVMAGSRSWSEPPNYFRCLTDIATTSPTKPAFPLLPWRAV